MQGVRNMHSSARIRVSKVCQITYLGSIAASVSPGAPRSLHRADAIPSLALVATQFALRAPEAAAAPLRPRLLAALVPWAMMHHHAARAMSVLCLAVGA